MDKDKLAENLLGFLPTMYRKLMRVHPSFEMPKQQMGLLYHISKDDGKPMSHYSEKMMVPKSNLTVIADKLISEGYVEREFDPDDRRVINLALTEKGKDYINENVKRIKEEMVKRLDSFDENDIKRLNELIEEIKEIFSRLE